MTEATGVTAMIRRGDDGGDGCAARQPVLLHRGENRIREGTGTICKEKRATLNPPVSQRAP